jgi:hypothetical protein
MPARFLDKGEGFLVSAGADPVVGLVVQRRGEVGEEGVGGWNPANPTDSGCLTPHALLGAKMFCIERFGEACADREDSDAVPP